MRRRLFVLALMGVVVQPGPAHAQMSITDSPARGAVYVETGVGGTMVVCCSLNLELPVDNDTVVRLASAADLIAGEAGSKTVLATAVKLFGRRGRYLEVGGGLVGSTCCVHGSEMWKTRASFDVGFRAYCGGTIARIAFTPIAGGLAGSPHHTVTPALGVSVGRTF
jgi:hypothetical protein